MKIWKYSRLDALLFLTCLAQLTATLWLASRAGHAPQLSWIWHGLVLLAFQWYNLLVISHQFTHTPWFTSEKLNTGVSILNSMNTGQSMTDYYLSHVHNHHRFNNDRHSSHKPARDWTSTFRGGKMGSHVSLFRYAFINTIPIMVSMLREVVAIHRWWRVGCNEQDLLSLLSRNDTKRSAQLFQMQLERIARFCALAVLIAISWQWALIVYIPVLYLSLCLFNLQNYYEHVGALPECPYSNSVSYYGKIYNFFTYNDGYHQEHHLRPRTHWRDLPKVRDIADGKLDRIERVISPVPAIIGFFYRRRPQLHASHPSQPHDKGITAAQGEQP